ncbi:MAG TPA: NAD(P)-binding domain-containing protein [Candidatus Bathyarchaeia archaeon]|nr:NAD(P)-binding domain-containing protein [Candidatus Bathyarchaeia archaeon]
MWYIICNKKMDRRLENTGKKRNSVVPGLSSNMQSPVKTQQRRHVTADFNRVLVVGLGQLGLPVAKYIKERGYDAYGYDINSTAMHIAEKASIKKAADFGEFDVYILCVSTHRPGDIFSPHIDGLLSVIEKISDEAKNGALLSIESTIPKGTSKKVFEALNHRLHVVHAPHRWYAAEEKDHGINQHRVIGGVCECCLNVGMQFYGDAKVYRSSSPSQIPNDNNFKSLGIPMHSVREIEVAELTKVVENAHRYLQIAFAQELYLYCQANNVNFPELRDAVNTKWNVDILEPREGVGGHCLPKDTKMFLQSSKSIRSKIVSAAIEVDHDYRTYRHTKGQSETRHLI